MKKINKDNVLSMKFCLSFILLTVLSATGCGIIEKIDNELYPPGEKTIPVAKISVDSEKVKVGSQVTLNATSSTDPKNQALTYAWTILEIPNGSSATLKSPAVVITTFTTDKGGYYTIGLVVTNATNDVSPLVTVRIDAVGTGDNHPPVANAGVDQSVTTGEVAVLEGSSSYDVDEEDLTYSWTLVGAPDTSTLTGVSSSSSANAFLYPDVDGSYTVRLRVSDGTDSDDDFVVVTSKAAESS